MSDKVVVRFLKAWRGYSADELAGFDEEVAEGLKSKGFAEVYEGDNSAAGKSKTGKPGAKSANKPGAGAPSRSTDTPPTGTGDGEGGAVGTGDDADAKP